MRSSHRRTSNRAAGTRAAPEQVRRIVAVQRDPADDVNTSSPAPAGWSDATGDLGTASRTDARNATASPLLRDPRGSRRVTSHIASRSFPSSASYPPRWTRYRIAALPDAPQLREGATIRCRQALFRRPDIGCPQHLEGPGAPAPRRPGRRRRLRTAPPFCPLPSRHRRRSAGCSTSKSTPASGR